MEECLVLKDECRLASTVIEGDYMACLLFKNSSKCEKKAAKGVTSFTYARKPYKAEPEGDEEENTEEGSEETEADEQVAEDTSTTTGEEPAPTRSSDPEEVVAEVPGVVYVQAKPLSKPCPASAEQSLFYKISESGLKTCFEHCATMEECAAVSVIDANSGYAKMHFDFLEQVSRDLEKVRICMGHSQDQLGSYGLEYMPRGQCFEKQAFGACEEEPSRYVCGDASDDLSWQMGRACCIDETAAAVPETAKPAAETRAPEEEAPETEAPKEQEEEISRFIMEPRPNVSCDEAESIKMVKLYGQKSEEMSVKACKTECLEMESCRLAEITKRKCQKTGHIYPVCNLYKSKKACQNGVPGVTFAKKRPSEEVETCDPLSIQYGVRLVGKKSYKKKAANPCICSGICASENIEYFTYNDNTNICGCISKENLSATKTNREFVSSTF